jgi:hypothetical protein
MRLELCSFSGSEIGKLLERTLAPSSTTFRRINHISRSFSGKPAALELRRHIVITYVWVKNCSLILAMFLSFLISMEDEK